MNLDTIISYSPITSIAHLAPLMAAAEIHAIAAALALSAMTLGGLCVDDDDSSRIS